MKLPAYKVRAINDALTSENRIHSDDIARRYGFTGALVSGVSVFGYLTHPLVAELGIDWFSNTEAEVRFLKPAYENDVLDIRSVRAENDGRENYQVSVVNPERVQLAELVSRRNLDLPPPDPRSRLTAPAEEPDRPEIGWDLIDLDKPAPVYRFTVDIQRQREALALMRDDLDNYRQGENPVIHPYLLLKECNHALMRMFVLPAWIHVGSRLILREPVRVGQTLDVVTVPIEKWERKGHQFIRLYIAMRSGQTVALEVLHTAIFRIAGS